MHTFLQVKKNNDFSISTRVAALSKERASLELEQCLLSILGQVWKMFLNLDREYLDSF